MWGFTFRAEEGASIDLLEPDHRRRVNSLSQSHDHFDVLDLVRVVRSPEDPASEDDAPNQVGERLVPPEGLGEALDLPPRLDLDHAKELGLSDGSPGLADQGARGEDADSLCLRGLSSAVASGRDRDVRDRGELDDVGDQLEG